jgi:hypothetical protein
MDEHRCWLCGRNGVRDHLDIHHVFNGALKKKSEKYGLLVYLCHNRCHESGPKAVHRNPETRRQLCQWAQRKAMEENGWTMEDWHREFGKNWLDEEESS